MLDYCITPSLNTQSCIRRPLCSTFKFENLRSPPKNDIFLGKKIQFFLLILCNVLVAHNRPQTFFFLYWPGCPYSPETEIQYHQKPLNAGLGIIWTGESPISWCRQTFDVSKAFQAILAHFLTDFSTSRCITMSKEVYVFKAKNTEICPWVGLRTQA